MGKQTRIQRQLIEEVAGYLDLATVLTDRYPLTRETRDRIAKRALDTLGRLGEDYRQSAIGLHYEGQAYRVMERYSDAISPLRAARDADPENINVLLTLGWCYKRINRIDAAIESLEDALAIEPDEAIILYNLACCYQRLNMLEDCASYLDGCIYNLESKVTNFDDNEGLIHAMLQNQGNYLGGTFSQSQNSLNSISSSNAGGAN